jgi:hypothetical protein
MLRTNATQQWRCAIPHITRLTKARKACILLKEEECRDRLAAAMGGAFMRHGRATFGNVRESAKTGSANLSQLALDPIFRSTHATPLAAWDQIAIT